MIQKRTSIATAPFSGRRGLDPAIVVPLTATSFDGFRAWVRDPAFPDWCRVELIGGSLFIDMSPERSESHGKVKGEVFRVLASVVKERHLGAVYCDRMRIANAAATLSNEPDILFVSVQARRSGRVQVAYDEDHDFIEFTGSPDCVVEVVSPSSIQKDTVQLMTAYWLAGVREYWLIDARGEEIQFQLFTHGPRAYVAVTPQRGGWVRSGVFGRRFRLVRQRDTLGEWEYTLECKR